ncbi:MAG: hypothetical protein JNG86_12455 [Verrucomicrobiaceae bacterium]|nr:hypothetical protein [Verrucomicrobiaceae bacterium]
MKSTHTLQLAGLFARSFLARVFACMILVTAALALDVNKDGMDDLWQARYNIAAFAGSADPDGDGRINFAEAMNMTDPLNTQNPGLGMIFITDLNPADGLDDRWQTRFSLTAADKLLDHDGDGRSNLEENYVGSDPFVVDEPWSNAGSTQGGGAAAGPQEFILTMPWTVPGWRYTLQCSDTLMQNEWSTAAVASGQNVSQWGTGGALSVTATTGGAERKFYRWLVDSPDTDADLLSDWAEMQLGLDPLNPDSDGDGYPDGAEVAGGANASNAASNPVYTPNPESGLSEHPVYLKRLSRVVSNSWSRIRHSGGETSNGQVSWWDDVPSSGSQNYTTFEARWAAAYGETVFPVSVFSRWETHHGASTASAYLYTHEAPGTHGYDSGSASINHRAYTVATSASGQAQPWLVVRRFFAFERKRTLPEPESGLSSETTLSNVRAVTFTVPAGQSSANAVVESTPLMADDEENQEYLGEMMLSTPQAPEAYDDQTLPRWIMVPKGGQQVVSFWMNTSWPYPPAYQASGGGLTPAGVVRHSENELVLSSETAGDGGYLKLGFAKDEGSTPVFPPDSPGNRLVNVTVKPRKLLDVKVIPITYLSAGGAATPPPGVPSATDVAIRLYSAFTQQANIECSVTVADPVPVYYDVGIGAGFDQPARYRDDGMLELYWDPYRQQQRRKSAEEQAINDAAPPASTGVTVYYVAAPQLMFLGTHTSAQAADTGKTGVSENYGQDGGIAWEALHGAAPTLAPDGGPAGRTCFVWARTQVPNNPTVAWTIAHEIGHLLGLKHTIDDRTRGQGYLSYADNEKRLMTGRFGPKRNTNPIRMVKAEWDVVGLSELLDDDE